jgi:hypothetical protein
MSALQIHPQYSSLSTQGLDPRVEALINRIVATRLEDADIQLSEQNNAWKRQEAEMLEREMVMREAIETLNAQLATARSEAAEAQQIHWLVHTHTLDSILTSLLVPWCLPNSLSFPWFSIQMPHLPQYPPQQTVVFPNPERGAERPQNLFQMFPHAIPALQPVL